MAANAWLAKLNVSPEDACRCGHNAHVHYHGKDCTALVDESKMTYCKCSEFRAATGSQTSNQGEEEMVKKARKPKGEGRKSNLLYFVDKEKLEKFEDGKLLDKKEKTYVAAIARTLVDAGKDGASFETLVKEVGKIVEHKNEKTLRKNIQWYLGTKKSGVYRFVDAKRVESAPKAEKKPKAPRKPRQKRPTAQEKGNSEASTEQ